MSGMEDRLSIDVSEALAAAARVDAAFAQIGQTFQQAIEQALASVQTVDATVAVTAETDTLTSEVDAALAASESVVPVTADTTGLPEEIDAAVAAADPTVDVHADVSEAENAIAGLSGESIDVGVTATGADDAAASLDSVGASAHAAGGEAHGAAGEFAALGVGAKLAAGETGALTEGLHLTGAAGATAAGAFLAVAVAGKELFSNALSARSAEERFNLVLGQSAEAVEHINFGGLNTDLKELGLRLGTAGPSMENAASKIFGLGTNAGVAAPKVAETTKQIIALAARAVALNPALGDVGAVAERALSGLARGGRFAANLQISLTGAEIAARALADTGKTVAADLTIYEKAAAGAELATEKLGTGLSTDINAGAENIKTQFASIKARFEDALETLGKPLLDPVLEAFTKAQPALIALAGVFAELLPPLVEIGTTVLSSVVPAFDALAPVATVVGAALSAVANVLAIIPGPLKTTAFLIIGLSIAFDKLAASAAASAIANLGGAGLAGSLTKLAAIANPVTIAIAASAAAFLFVKNNAKEADASVQSYLDSWVGVLQQQTTIAGYEEQIQGVTDAANQYGDAANKLNSPEGKLFHSGEFRQATETATGLRSVRDVALTVVEEAKQLQTQYHLTDVAALQLASGGDEVVASFKAQADAASGVTDALNPATHAQDEFWLAATSGALSAGDIENQAAALNISFDDLAKGVQEARQPVLDFAAGIQDALPGAEKALNDLGDNQGLHKFLQNLDTNLAESAAFVGNLQTLIDRGATSLADTIAGLAKTDPTKAAKVAADAVKESAKALDSDEAKAKAASAGRTLVDIAAQNVADELHGGKFDLAFAQTQDAIGDKFLKMPGQLDSSITIAGSNIAAQLSVAISSDPSLTTILPASLLESGKNAAAAFDAGFTGNDAVAASIAAQQKAQKVIDSVKKVFDIKSPSKVMQEIGKDVSAGFFLGLADTEGAAKAIDPIEKVIDQFKLNAAQIAAAPGDSIDAIAASLTKLGEAEKTITADELKEVGKAVAALGGPKGVESLQKGLAERVAAAFKGLDTKGIEDVVSQLNTRAALGRIQSIVGVTPVIPKAFDTNVVKGGDSTAAPIVGGDLVVNVTPPPDATSSEIAGDVAVAAAWALNGVAP